MGFMDKLKEIGLGNTGPRGNMNSGATNYSNYAKERQAYERSEWDRSSESGLAQDIAAAAKDGKQIPYNKTIEFAEKWKKDPREVAKRVREQNQATTEYLVKTQGHQAILDYQTFVKEKKRSPNEQDIQEYVRKTGITDPAVMQGVAAFVQSTKSMNPKEKYTTLADGAELHKTVGGKTTMVASNPKEVVPKEPKTPTEISLLQKAQDGDKNAQKLLDALMKRKEGAGKAAAKGKLGALFEAMGTEGVAQAVIEGRETLENVKNTFGVPIQEVVRSKVLEIDPKFNFVIPRAVVKSLSSSLANQEKQRGMMGGFVRNINKQLTRVDEIYSEVSRWGARFLDLPKRELITRMVGSGKEKTLEAYMTEISNEIAKLSTGSQASIRELSTEAQERWAKIHDVNLSFNEMKTILEETRQMAEMRISSSNEELEFTKSRLKNLKSGGSATLQRSGIEKEQPPSKFQIISVTED